jgi:hypothetical protein
MHSFTSFLKWLAHLTIRPLWPCILIKFSTVRNTNRNWHTLGQGIETSGRSSVKRNVYPIVWPYMPIAKYPDLVTHTKVSGENLYDQG